MHKADEVLIEIIARRIRAAGCSSERYLQRSSAVVVFGSMAVGLDKPDSDIDVLCIGQCDSKLKTDLLDVIVLSEGTLRTPGWLHSELASHVSHYGVFVKGKPDWCSAVKLAGEAIEAKRRRVASFMRALPHSWDNLEEGFRIKYSVKVRREMQRLLLLERGTPIPPTRMLDSCAADASVNASVCERMRGLVRSEAKRDFIENFLTYLSANWRVVENLPVH